MTTSVFSLPMELTTRIFDEFASSLELKRVMRRRVVSHQFKRFIDDAIFRLCLLDGHKHKNQGHKWVGQYVPRPERHFIAEYFAYQAAMTKESTSFIGRIWRAAENPGVLNALFIARRRSHPTECSAESLAADDCVAAVYLGDRAYIEALAAQGTRFCDWGDVVDVKSDIFGSAFDAATLTGGVPMMRLLLSSNPNYNPPESIMPFDLQLRIFKQATFGGYVAAFDFALESGPSLILEAGEQRKLSVPEYDCFMWAIFNTPSIENYQRGTAMFSLNSKIYQRGIGSLNMRLIRSAGYGHVDKLNYFLGLVPPPNDGETKATRDQRINGPLLWGICSGNVEVVKLLLAHGADPNWSSPGETALMKAASISSIPIVKMLIEAGARVDEGSPPPIVVAVFKEDMEMFKLLRGHGARLDSPETGNWAMAVARFYQLDCMIRILEQQGIEKDAILHRCANIEERFDYKYIFKAPPHLEWEHDPETGA